MPNPEEYRRTRRIVDLLLRIANQPRRWTRRALAERYEVSERQLDKDLDMVRNGLVMPLRHCREGSRGLVPWKKKGRDFSEGGLHLRLCGSRQGCRLGGCGTGYGGKQVDVYVMHDAAEGAGSLMYRLGVQTGMGPVMDRKLSTALFELLGDNGWHLHYAPDGSTQGFHITHATELPEDLFTVKVNRLVDRLRAAVYN